MEQKDFNKKLVAIKVSYNEEDETWSFHPEHLKPMYFKADETKIKRLLRRIKAKDSLTEPRSKKGVTYKTMVDEINSNGESTIYTWKSHCPISRDVLLALLKE